MISSHIYRITCYRSYGQVKGTAVIWRAIDIHGPISVGLTVNRTLRNKHYQNYRTRPGYSLVPTTLRLLSVLPLCLPIIFQHDGLNADEARCIRRFEVSYLVHYCFRSHHAKLLCWNSGLEWSLSLCRLCVSRSHLCRSGLL